MRKVKILTAYPYCSAGIIKMLSEHKDRITFVLDSGAFTAWKVGKVIHLDDYCKFIESLPITPWRYFNLDVIGDPHATMKNYELMLKRGFKPVPIFTRGEDPSVLDDYYKTSDLVGIGGLVGTDNNKGFVNGIMKHVKGRRVHLLGFASLPFLKFYKPYMADSSSWESGARYAHCQLYLGGGKRPVGISRKNVLEKLKDPTIVAAILRLGLSPSDLLKPANWNGGYSITRRLGARSMRLMSWELEEKLGVNLFLATATTIGIDLFTEDLK